MKITFVKKILADGSPCRKCGDVVAQLEKNNQMQFIDETLIADERDPASPGMLLALELGVDRAPFFVTTKEDGSSDIYTVYMKFAKEVLNQNTSKVDEDKDVLDSHDLDFL